MEIYFCLGSYGYGFPTVIEDNSCLINVAFIPVSRSKVVYFSDYFPLDLDN